MNKVPNQEDKSSIQKRSKKYRSRKNFENNLHSRPSSPSSKTLRNNLKSLQESKRYSHSPSGRGYTVPDDALGELAAILSQNVQLSAFNQTNMVQANIEAAEGDLKSLEAACTERISYFLSPSDLKNISMNADQANPVKHHLETLYGTLPSSFIYEKKNESKCERPPYSGSCFNKINQNLNELKSPPKSWI